MTFFQAKVLDHSRYFALWAVSHVCFYWLRRTDCAERDERL